MLLLLLVTGCRTTLPTNDGSGGDAAGGGGTDGSGGDAPSCDTFVDEDVDSEGVVTIRLVNQTDQAIYIGATNETCEFPGYTVENENGEGVTTRLLSCMHRCESLRESGCGCFLGCEVFPVVTIEPGNSYDAAWQRTLYSSEVMPPSCFADPTCFEEGDRCFIARAPVESLVFVGAAYPSVDIEGEPREVRATWNPGDTSVDIVFD